MNRPRVLIVSEHASAQFGGEAALPLHYFRVLRQRGYEVWLITHARARDGLAQLYPNDSRILYIEDTGLHRLMWHISRIMPAQISYFTVGFVSRVAVQLAQRVLARKLVLEEKIDVIHQPMPVSPREPSLMYGFGVPVIIGPMNGGMDYPPAFRRSRGIVENTLLRAARWSSSFLNRLMPGKHRAALLLVANQRTRASLPPGVSSKVLEIVENGVDLSLWRPTGSGSGATIPEEPTTFVFMGRLVKLKAVDLLLQAFKRAAAQSAIRLQIVGDGPERGRLEELASNLGIHATSPEQSGRAFFTGWLSQNDCATQLQHAHCLVMPSILECGGAVVLEAMSMGKPIIATAWGGPEDYVDDKCGILVPPSDEESLIQGFADAMVRLSGSQAIRLRLGEYGRQKVVQEYDWEVKIDRILELYDQVRANT